MLLFNMIYFENIYGLDVNEFKHLKSLSSHSSSKIEKIEELSRNVSMEIRLNLVLGSIIKRILESTPEIVKTQNRKKEKELDLGPHAFSKWLYYSMKNETSKDEKRLEIVNKWLLFFENTPSEKIEEYLQKIVNKIILDLDHSFSLINKQF